MRKYILIALLVIMGEQILYSQCRITHLSGVQNYNGIEVTVNQSGSVDTYTSSACQSKLTPFWVGIHYNPLPFSCGTGSYSFVFSPPITELYLTIGGVNSEVGGNSEIIRLYKNGLHYPFTILGDTLSCMQSAVISPEGDMASPNWNIAGWQGVKIDGPISSLMVLDSVLSGCPNGVAFSLSFCQYPLSVGEVEMKAGEIEVYPNPSSGKFQVKCKNSKSQKMLYNTIGEMILSTKENEIDVSHLPKGVYFLKSEGQVRKVIVE